MKVLALLAAALFVAQAPQAALSAPADCPTTPPPLPREGATVAVMDFSERASSPAVFVGGSGNCLTIDVDGEIIYLPRGALKWRCTPRGRGSAVFDLKVKPLKKCPGPRPSFRPIPDPDPENPVDPSPEPSPEASASPSPVPSSEPSPEPSPSNSPAPSPSSSPAPSSEPSPEPSPSNSPAPSPSNSPAPSSEPSPEPSPSNSPAPSPSNSPAPSSSPLPPSPSPLPSNSPAPSPGPLAYPCLAAGRNTVFVSYPGIGEFEQPLIQTYPTTSCVHFYFSGNSAFVEAGAFSCRGDAIIIPNGGVQLRETPPSSCIPPPDPCPTVPPTEVGAGGGINIYYSYESNMIPVQVTRVMDKCYEVDYSGASMTFPKSAYQWRCGFSGPSRAGLDYNQRYRFQSDIDAQCHNTPLTPSPSPSPYPAPIPGDYSCLTPDKTQVRLDIQNGRDLYMMPLMQILPETNCVQFSSNGNSAWALPSAIQCIGQGLINVLNGGGVEMRTTAPPSCLPPRPPCPTSAPPAVGVGSGVKIYYDDESSTVDVGVIGASNNCYEVSYSGISLWFPKWSYQYRCSYPSGNEILAALNYNDRSENAC